MPRKNIQAGQSYTLDSELGILKGIKSGLKEIYIEDQKGVTVAVTINSDKSFITFLSEGVYKIWDNKGNVLKSGISIEKGKIVDLGSF